MKKNARKPTENELALYAFGLICEETGVKPSHYYRLLSQIEQATAIVKAYEKRNV